MGNLKPKLKWFSNLKLEPKKCILNCLPGLRLPVDFVVATEVDRLDDAAVVVLQFGPLDLGLLLDGRPPAGE